MHGLRFADEVDGDRAEHAGPGPANLYPGDIAEGFSGMLSKAP